MARIKKETIKKEITNERWVDAYFNHNFNGRLTSKSLYPDLTLESAEVHASRMLGNDKVKELIAIKHEEIRIKQEITLEFIVNGLKRIIYDVMQEEIERDENGKITSKPDRKSALAAYQQLTKIGGFESAKKVDVTTNGESLNLKDLIEFKTPKKLND